MAEFPGSMENLKGELIFVPWPMMGHLGQLVEFAKLLLTKNPNLSIKVLISKLPESIDPVTNTLVEKLIASSTVPSLHFATLPAAAAPPPEWSSLSRGYFIQQQLLSQKPLIKEFIADSSTVLGILVDMFSTSVIDVAADLGLPSYVFFTSGAAFLGVMLDFQQLQDERGIDVCDFPNSESDLVFPSFENPVPPSVLPIVLTDRQLWSKRFIICARQYRKAKGIVVNAFAELESHAMDYLDLQHRTGKLPRVYPIGPVLNQVQNANREVQFDILEWLNEQPAKSVVYVSFGSLGSLEMEQARELAKGLERSGHRFLWVLRRPPLKDSVVEMPAGYDEFWDILPEGFSERTKSVGKIVGWAPQLEVLSHGAVGGFVSHCGWNSTLESIWCGVPLATWPLNSEQQLNAFQLVVELGLSVQITLDFSSTKEDQGLVTAEEIENGVRKVMESDGEVRRRVLEMRDKSRACVEEGGSSFQALQNLMQSMFEGRTLL